MPLAGAWLGTWICLGFAFGWSRAARPRFDTSTDMGLVLVPADAEVDSVIFRLRATDQDADFPLVFEITATITPVVRIENLPCTLYNKVCQANVILTRRLVPGRLHDFAVRVRDSKGDTNSMQATISVTNATTPRDQIFPHIPSLIMVPEDTKPGKELDYLLVRANSWSGKPVYIELWQPKELFTIRQRQTPTQTRGVITLIGELDFETQSMYTLTMYATDPYTEPGKDTRNIAGLNAVVVVQDVQDVPPIFTLAPPLTKINNSVQTGDIVLRVHAEDGDKGVPREIAYGLVSEGNPFTPFFNISETTGEIALARPLEELTQITHVGAPVVLSVVAEEIRRSTDEPPAQATVVEVGFLLGEPGNSPPYFESDNYMAVMDENLEPGTVIVFPEQYSAKVRDEDIGKAGVFALKLENNNGTFEISPAVAERVADFVVTVRDNALIDYETYKSLIFKITAQEVGPATNLSTTVPVTIYLRDINDNSPVFEEESYEVTLSENVTAGTRVVQVHATDKDTGSFGRIRYTRIVGDGSDAFTLDPDTGWITVSMGSSLDREATPRLQLSVEARDEDGEGNRGAVPLTVNLLDVNDNAPLFEKDVYEFTLNADLTNFTTPAVIKAIDADSEPPNNDVRYELVHGNYENKFYLDEITGELILRSPVTKIRRKKQSVYESLGKKLRKEFVRVEEVFRDLMTNVTVKDNVTKATEDTRNGSKLIEQIEEIVKKSRRKRANDDALYTLTARAYDLGVPHMSSLTQIRVIRAAFMEARIVMFVVPGERPDPEKTAETLSTITGGRVIIQEIRPYVALNVTNAVNMPAGKKSIVLARVEQNGPDTPLVDIEKIRETLAANGVGIIGTTVTVTDIINTPKSSDTEGSNANSSVKAIIEEEAIIYKAENKVLFWLLLILGLLMLAAIATLILCCICPSCPFYMAPRKRRVHSSEALITRPNGRPKRHMRRTHATTIDASLTEKKQAWSADPTRRNWQFNRRNTRTLGLASLPGDVAYISYQPNDGNVRTLRLRDGPTMDREDREDAAYSEDIEAQRIHGYEMADADSLRRHEMERDSDAHRQHYGYNVDADVDDEKLVREHHFFREGNAEVLRLVTRGPEETQQQQHQRTTLVVDGKEILLRRFIEDQELRHELQDAEAARSMESHKRSREVIAQQQGILLLPERLEMAHAEKLETDVPRLLLDQRDYEEASKAEQRESQMRQEQIRQEAQFRQEGVIPGLVASGVSATIDIDPSTLNVKDHGKAYAYDMELARQNALLTRLLLERESKAVGVALDSTSYLETQSLPGQVAIATQTDRTAGTQTERQVRSRSDNDESEDESRQKKKLKSKKRHIETDAKRRTLWMKSPIEEEDGPGFDKRLSVLRRKVREVKEGRKGSLEPDVLREISDSLDGADETTETTSKVYRRSTEETTVRYKMLDENESASSAELTKRKTSRIVADKSRVADERRRDVVAESTSSPEIKAKTRRSLRGKAELKSPKKEDRKPPRKSETSEEPSFRILEKEITLLTRKLSKLGEKKAQESTGSESTARDKTKSAKKDAKKDADVKSSKKADETRRLKSSTEPATSKSSVTEETETHRKENFLAKARQKLKHQQAALAASTASSELEDSSEKSKRHVSGTSQDAGKHKAMVSHSKLKRQAHVEKDSKKSTTASEDVDKQRTSSSKEMSGEEQKKDKPTKLVSRMKHLASIGRKEHVSEDVGVSLGKTESKKSTSSRRESERKTGADTSESASDHLAQRKAKKTSEKSKSDDSGKGQKATVDVEKDKKAKDVESTKGSAIESSNATASGSDVVKDALNGTVSKSMSVNEVLKHVTPVEEKDKAASTAELQKSESKIEAMIDKQVDLILTKTEEEIDSMMKERKEKEETTPTSTDLHVESSEVGKAKLQIAEHHMEKPEKDIENISKDQSTSIVTISEQVASPVKKVDEVTTEKSVEIVKVQPETSVTVISSTEIMAETLPSGRERETGDEMELKEIATESEEHKIRIKDENIKTEIEEDLSAGKTDSQPIDLPHEKTDTVKDIDEAVDKIIDTMPKVEDELKSTAESIVKIESTASQHAQSSEDEKKDTKSSEDEKKVASRDEKMSEKDLSEDKKGPQSLSEDETKSPKSPPKSDKKSPKESSDDEKKSRKSPSEDEKKSQMSPSKDEEIPKSSFEDEKRSQKSPLENGKEGARSPFEDEKRSRESPPEDKKEGPESPSEGETSRKSPAHDEKKASDSPFEIAATTIAAEKILEGKDKTVESTQAEEKALIPTEKALEEIKKLEDQPPPEEKVQDVEVKHDKDEKQEAASEMPVESKEEAIEKDKGMEEKEEKKDEVIEKEQKQEIVEVKSEDKEEIEGKKEKEAPLQPAMQYLDVSTPIFTSAIDTLGDSDDSDTSSDISRKTTLTAGPYQTPRHRARKSSGAEYDVSEKKRDADERLVLEVPATSTKRIDDDAKGVKVAKSVSEDDLRKRDDDKSDAIRVSGVKSVDESKGRVSRRGEVEDRSVTGTEEDQSASGSSRGRDKPASGLKEDQRSSKVSVGKDKPAHGLKGDQKATTRVIDSGAAVIVGPKQAPGDEKRGKPRRGKFGVSPARREKKSSSEETSRDKKPEAVGQQPRRRAQRVVGTDGTSGKDGEESNRPTKRGEEDGEKRTTGARSRPTKEKNFEEKPGASGKDDEESSKPTKRGEEDGEKHSTVAKIRPTKEKTLAVGEKPGTEPDVSKTRSKYMAWYKQKRDEMERRRHELKEDEEEQLPRWLRRSLGYRKSDARRRQPQQQQPDASRSSETTPRRRVKPLVNVESEQLRAIVRQGRKLRRAGGGGNEDPPVQIFASTPPAASPQHQPHHHHHLLQHSEYKFERMPAPTPFYLHPPPPAPHPSPQLSPIRDEPRRTSEYVRPEEEYDSGVGLPLQGGARLRHQQLLEKKSVFDIAYSEAAPGQLRSDSTTPPS